MFITNTGLPSTAGSGATVTSSVINALGLTRGAVGLQSSVAGTLSVQRYVDAAGVVPMNTALTVALTANTPNSVGWADGLPCGSIIVSYINSAGGTATLSNSVVLLSP